MVDESHVPPAAIAPSMHVLQAFDAVSPTHQSLPQLAESPHAPSVVSPSPHRQVVSTLLKLVSPVL